MAAHGGPSEGGEGLVAELEEPDRFSEVLEAMLAKVAHVRLDELAGGLRDDDLAARRDGANPRCAVDVEADIALVD